ncbi:2-phospho-L-lactate guanylyltransferase [Nocardia camponoti]|uniref:Phosphoenolpyruvate guanylyltransferase n=1 Tax=Nocardia camponoti TaxID=1616106 RepID=A0A917QC76_9NOCA|nr:2-phospho-L-lactate guanylyltransferase [Nocardia camponoti]GGK43145.1 2-phospho-L-lactate guanylyltransferase [Nocardia camponoti]
MHPVHAVMAVKHTDRAKSRLAEVLTPAQRGALVLAMVTDTLAAASAVDVIAGITVVTPDLVIATRAREFGAHVVAEPATPTPGVDALNSALIAGARTVRERFGPTRLLALQADLPALRPNELADVIARSTAHERVVVIDHTGTGTAALLVGDPVADLDPRFGPSSADAHRDSGAVSLGGSMPGLRHDVDTPADLTAVAALGVGPHTAAALTEFGYPTQRSTPISAVC